MRTTVNLDGNLLGAARIEAQRRGYSVSQLLEEALRRELALRTSVQGPALPVFRGGTGPVPGVDLRSNRALIEHLDEE